MLSVSYGVETLPGDMVRALSSDEFAKRESAQADLREWSLKNATVAAPELLMLSRKDEDPEIRKRSLDILRSLADAEYLSDGQGYLGILMQEEIVEQGGEGREAAAGIRVLDVMKGSPAELADLRRGDLIVSLDGKGWKGIGAVTEFSEAVAAKKPLVDVILKVKRGDLAAMEITVKLGKRPVPDLRMAGGDLGLLEEQAKDRHFKNWLKKHEAK